MTSNPAFPVISRLFSAVFGGYLLASSIIVASAALLPGQRASAVMASSLSSYAIYTAAVIWAFAARTTRGAWFGVLAPSVLVLAVAAVAWIARGLA
ncbi:MULTISPECIES: hypothetical protein [unclassified Cupriavidus]|uniref:hypothetical protein n=1 Tax=unclassified Cupriavidus TaxID=2640874 RepID=UPI0010F64EE9|nr:MULTISPECIES: hypothetical protein [unclassified Cupriavidus]MWL89398.1 hypothetical protein [Cupriavidus sp. SW-Y-13]